MAPHSVTVTSTAGTATTSPANFVVKPRVTGFSPTSGSMGTAVTITGSGFNGATNVYFGFNGTFNATPAPFTAVSSTQISTSVPGGATTGRIGVVTPVDTVNNSSNFPCSRRPRRR